MRFAESTSWRLLTLIICIVECSLARGRLRDPATPGVPPMARMKLRPRSLILPGILALFASCGDEEPSTNNGGAANYVVAARIFGEDNTGTTTYLHLVSSLDEGTVIDPQKAIELPGSAKVFA